MFQMIEGLGRPLKVLVQTLNDRAESQRIFLQIIVKSMELPWTLIQPLKQAAMIQLTSIQMLKNSIEPTSDQIPKDSMESQQASIQAPKDLEKLKLTSIQALRSSIGLPWSSIRLLKIALELQLTSIQALNEFLELRLTPELMPENLMESPQTSLRESINSMNQLILTSSQRFEGLTKLRLISIQPLKDSMDSLFSMIQALIGLIKSL